MLNNWWQFRIAPRLVLFSLLAILPIIFIGGSYIYVVFEEQIIKQVEKSLQNNLNIVKYHLAQEKEQISLSAQIIASDPALRKALDSGLSLGLNAQLNRIARIYPNLNYLLLLDIDKNIFAINTIDDKKRKLATEDILDKQIAANKIIPQLNQNANNGNIAVDPYLKQLNLPTKKAQWFSAPVMVRGKIKGWILLSYRWTQAMHALKKELVLTLNSEQFPIIGSAITSQTNEVLAGDLSKHSDVLQQSISLIINNNTYLLVM